MSTERAIVIGILVLVFLVVLFVAVGVLDDADAAAAVQYVRSSWGRAA